MEPGSSKRRSKRQCTLKSNPKASPVPRAKPNPKPATTKAKIPTPEKLPTLENVASKRVPVYKQLALLQKDGNEDSDIYDILSDSVIEFKILTKIAHRHSIEQRYGRLKPYSQGNLSKILEC